MSTTHAFGADAPVLDRSDAPNRLSTEIFIHADADQVWRVLADLGDIQSYHPAVRRSYYATEERSGVGAARVCEFPGGVSLEERAVEWREGSGYTLEIVKGKKAPPFSRAFGRFDLEPVEGGTRVRLAFSWGMKYGIVGRLMDRFAVRPQFEKVLPAVLAGLRDRVEALPTEDEAQENETAA